MTPTTSQIDRTPDLAPNKATDWFLPATYTQRTLHRERARANRTGEHLSLLSFRFPDAPARSFAWPELARCIRARLRCTDEAGWLEEGIRAGVILPATPASGAWKLADDIILELAEGLPRPECIVYTHGSGTGAMAGENGEATESEDRVCQSLDLLFVQALPIWKRTLDIVLSATALLVFSPVLAVIALVVKMSSPGPAFFRQRRAGRGGRVFVMLKFRTMCADAEKRKAELRAQSEQDGPAFKLRKDPRVTRIGKILRTTSLDELPQLWNVLRGEMSIVGPRPLPCDEMDACDRWQRQRLDVQPGLTCIWQVSGRSRVSFVEWIRMDLRYIRSRSIWQDIKLIVMTVPAVLFRRGAH
ncbi:MAG: sugar transferase [Gemmataceae bacterium]